uniref:malate dehydrogenase n=1 Tax=Cucumis sativus TaxID=3659 RepID=A0A0A0LSB1_CUCSA
MAATSVTSLSIGATASLNTKLNLFSQSKSASPRINSLKLQSFCGLKADSSLRCDSESSFLGKQSSAALWRHLAPSAQRENLNLCKSLQPQASYKVAVLGAAGGIGQPLALLIKMSPLVATLNLYDIANVKGVAADISHCNTPSKVQDFTGPSELANALKGVDVVVIPAGVPRKPGMTRDDLFNINAGIVKSLVEAVADNCPDAFIHIISNPVNSTVPIAAEVLKQKDEQIQELTIRTQNGGTEVVEAKAGAGSATLSMAYAAARFVESSLRALDGDSDVFECTFVESDLTELPFFASRVKLGKKGVEAFVTSDLHGLSEYEQKALEALKPELKASIEKGIAFAHKQAVAA